MPTIFLDAPLLHTAQLRGRFLYGRATPLIDDFSPWFWVGQQGSRVPAYGSRLGSEEIQGGDKARWERWQKSKRGERGKESLRVWGGSGTAWPYDLVPSCNRRHHGLGLHMRAGSEPGRHHLLPTDPEQAGAWTERNKHSCLPGRQLASSSAAFLL